eukprot:TRINITY_DN1671_c1_g1_i1.p1 TRINITY_DN1671_c1_g1~~TRINITY_DN1671_c1_g1_i1.p1  ORF type:complete len:152 (-),score=29.69 TRINITY_DN1671_c1_g1_i1:92-547(-)
MISPKSCWYFLRRYKRKLRLKSEKNLFEKSYWEGFQKGKNSVIGENVSQFNIGYLSGVIHTTRSLMKFQDTFSSSAKLPEYVLHSFHKLMSGIQTCQREKKFLYEQNQKLLREGIFKVKSSPVCCSIQSLYTPNCKRKRKSKKEEPFFISL